MFSDRDFQILYLILLLLFVGSGVTLRQNKRQMLRDAGWWLLIMAGLLLFYRVMAHFSA